MIFEDCICIAQARVIEGKRKKAHICTIAYHEPSDKFLRICLPFERHSNTAIRRWHRFTFEGSKNPQDTRSESYDFGELLAVHGKLSRLEQVQTHKQILSHYMYEDEMNEQKRSIGILLPVRSSFSFGKMPLEDREKEYRNIMLSKGIFFPPYKIYVTGKRSKDGKPFKKQFLQWDVYEAIRKNVDPFPALQSFADPYIILGNTPWTRNSFMAISILSAPSAAKQHAYHQQLELTHAF